jgi:hypothetical protein
MNTPTEEPVDPLAHASHAAREAGALERPPVDSDSEPFRSPYAPAKARERVGAERQPEESHNDPLRSPYAPKKARTQPAQAPDLAIREDVAPPVPSRGTESLGEHPGCSAVDDNQSYFFSHNPSLEASLQSASPRSRQQEQPAAARRDESIRDLKRLESTLRWIQREETAARIPRAAQLPPVAGLVTGDARGRRHGGETLDFPAPRSLEPQRMGPPPTKRSRRHKVRAPLMILIASIFAIAIGYYFSMGGWSPAPPPAPGPKMASLAAQTNAPASSMGREELPPTLTRDDDRAMSLQREVSSQRPEPSQPRRSSEGESVAMLQPSAPADQAPPASKAIRVLDPEEIKLLLKQGEQLIAAGDVVTARTVLQRAAEAGSANAAIALGATYDPDVLAKLGVVGVTADVEKARSWYQRAESLGSPDARGRLDLLAGR